jgi:phosphoglycolate phosphatase
MMMKYKTIVFDYDGTLHESMYIYYNAFLKAYDYLVSENLQPKRNWTKVEVSKFLGQNPKEMWASFIPKLSDDVITKVSSMVGKYMEEAIFNQEAKLYEGTIEVLEYLKNKGYKLIYLSNSKIYYLEAHKKAFNLDKYFDQFYVSEMFDYIPKHKILKKIKNEFYTPILMIGDRIHDIESGYLNQIDTVACLYGYGNEEEFQNATYKINDIKELMILL